MPLVPAASTLIPEGAGVGLIDDDELRAGADKLGSPPFQFDEIERNDDMRVTLKQRLADSAPSFKARCCRREHKLCIYIKLVVKLALPLFGKRRRTQHRGSFDLSPIKELARYERSLYRFPDTHVICDE